MQRPARSYHHVACHDGFKEFDDDLGFTLCNDYYSPPPKLPRRATPCEDDGLRPLLDDEALRGRGARPPPLLLCSASPLRSLVHASPPRCCPARRPPRVLVGLPPSPGEKGEEREMKRGEMGRDEEEEEG
uniref:Histone deacetylase HD2-like protein n=1 Tax=Oryza sativa subsp. japonica TaxID=39947 RepID=Q6YZB9_ORYSJ|nr:histone deacetylase HD2-like protein [Oryza sativa Japonica Group]BAD05758.1 histone deacetylase HD2-like protein [Oryza sativa Japonica Group]